MLRNLARTVLVSVCVLMSQVGLAQTAAPTPAVVPASPQLLEHLYQQLERRERPATVPGISPAAGAAMANADFVTTRQQLRTLGPKAAPLAPRVAELLLRTQANHYDLAWILFEMTVQEPNDAAVVAEMVRQYRSESPAGRLVALARIGKVRSPSAVPELLEAIRDESGPTRLLAAIGFAYAGSTVSDAAAPALGRALSDREKYVRTAAANSIRLLGAKARSTAPALIDYLKTRDNVYMAASALAMMPTEAVRPAKQELESILSDSRLTDFQKRDVTNLLIRLETENKNEQSL